MILKYSLAMQAEVKTEGKDEKTAVKSNSQLFFHKIYYSSIFLARSIISSHFEIICSYASLL